MISYHLRKTSKEDVDFIYELRSQTMKPLLETKIGRDEKEQYAYASDNLEEAQIILHKCKRIGVLKTLTNDTHITLHQIQILPGYQKNGIGKELIQQIIELSQQLNLPIKLTVIKNSQAHKLYEKCSFKKLQSFEHNMEMIRNP